MTTRHQTTTPFHRHPLRHFALTNKRHIKISPSLISLSTRSINIHQIAILSTKVSSFRKRLGLFSVFSFEFSNLIICLFWEFDQFVENGPVVSSWFSEKKKNIYKKTSEKINRKQRFFLNIFEFSFVLCGHFSNQIYNGYFREKNC